MQLSPGVYARLATILDPVRGAVSGSERRREPRMAVQGAGTVTSPGASGEEALTVQVQDVSLGGALLLASQDVMVGEQLVLVLEGPDGSAVSLLCSVAHCRQVGPDIYALGTQFLHGQGTDGGSARSNRTARLAPPPAEPAEPLLGSQRYRPVFNG